MERTGDIWRGDDNGERGLVAAGIGAEETGGYPLLVPSPLDVCGLVLSRQRLLWLPAAGGNLRGVGHPESLRPGQTTTTLRGAHKEAVRCPSPTTPTRNPSGRLRTT